MNIRPLEVKNPNTKFIQSENDGELPIDIASFLQQGQLYRIYKQDGVTWDGNASSPKQGEILCFVGVDTPSIFSERHKLVFIRQDGTFALWGFYWQYTTQYLPRIVKGVG